MSENKEIDVGTLLKVIAKKAWIIVLCAVIMGAAFLSYTVVCVTPKFQSKVTFYVNNGNSQSGMVNSTDLAVALKLVNTCVELLKDENVLEQVVDASELDITTSQLRGMLSASVVAETEMFEVRILSSDPQTAASVANTIAETAPKVIADITGGSEVKAIGQAKVPTSRHSPSYTKNTILGVVVGIIGAVAVIVMQSLLDVHIKTEEDLAKICSIPVVGMIPDVADEITSAQARRSVVKKG